MRKVYLLNKSSILLVSVHAFAIEHTAKICLVFFAIDAYSATTLGIGLVVIFLLTCWTLGTAIPSGLFVPTILIGAVYGRFFAAVFQ